MRAGLAAAALAMVSTRGARAAETPPNETPPNETVPSETIPNAQDVEGLEAAEPAEPAENPIEPDAMDALHRMGTYLRSLQSFSVSAKSTLDEVTDDGMKLQFGGTLAASVRRPDGLFLVVDTDRKHRRFYFDGKTLTMYAPLDGYYTTVPAPATIREMLQDASDRYGIQMPLLDLFSWGEDASSEEAVREAAIIGPSDVNGVPCDHVAIRQDDVDWQVWIEHGDHPLPRKIVITTKSEPQQPQYEATLTWNTDARFSPSTFQFTPPQGAHQIDIETTGGVEEEQPESP
jgi:hypothetical protein